MFYLPLVNSYKFNVSFLRNVFGYREFIDDRNFCDCPSRSYSSMVYLMPENNCCEMELDSKFQISGTFFKFQGEV